MIAPSAPDILIIGGGPAGSTAAAMLAMRGRNVVLLEKEAHPRFHMHFTPTYSSWLNQVERWFGLLTDKKIRRGAHKNLQALERDIRAWITQWNNDPKPFVWTKDADEILQRLAAYLDRIPGAGN